MGILLTEVSGDNLLTIERLRVPLEGIFLGTKELKVGHAYVIETDNGVAEIAGCTDLNKKMSKLKEGDYVRISNAGKLKTKSGREMFLSKVEASFHPIDPVLDTNPFANF